MANHHRYKKEIELLCQEGHRTADQIYKSLKKDYFFLGIGTVYRNLQELIEENVLMKTAGVGEKIIYEKKKALHGHLYCHRSGIIRDISLQDVDLFGIQLPDNFNLQNINIIFDGHFVDDNTFSCAGVVHVMKT